MDADDAWDGHAEPTHREDWEVREVYAAFGVAVYFAQVVEFAVVNHIAIARTVAGGRRLTGSEFDALFDELFGATLGRNLKELHALLSDDPSLSDDLRQALALRNRLVHHWMRERIMDMGTSRKRATMMLISTKPGNNSRTWIAG